MGKKSNKFNWRVRKIIIDHGFILHVFFHLRKLAVHKSNSKKKFM